jgi:hypothetical protein
MTPLPPDFAALPGFGIAVALPGAKRLHKKAGMAEAIPGVAGGDSS